MATLAQATQATRTFLKWAGIAFAVFLVIRLVLFPAAAAIFNVIFPKKPPPPTVAFGKLPRIPFPAGQKVSAGSYSIQTTTGALPLDLPDRLAVFAVTKKLAGFSSYDRAKQKVEAVGFTGEGTPLSQATYLWRHPKVEGREITFNTITESFTLTTKIPPSSSDPPLAGGPPPQSATAIGLAKNFLSAMSLLPDDLDDTKTKITFLKIGNGRLTKATSLSQSDFIQIDFYRKPLSDLVIVNASSSQSLLSFRIKSDENRSLAVTDAHFAYKAVDESQQSTYPIKTAQSAFAQLQQGQAFVAQGTNVRSPVAIQKVYLAYYEGDDNLDFFQPVFVFEGEGGFRAFVEAIQEQWQQ